MNRCSEKPVKDKKTDKLFIFHMNFIDSWGIRSLGCILNQRLAVFYLLSGLDSPFIKTPHLHHHYDCWAQVKVPQLVAPLQRWLISDDDSHNVQSSYHYQFHIAFRPLGINNNSSIFFIYRFSFSNRALAHTVAFSVYRFFSFDFHIDWRMKSMIVTWS